MKIDKKIIHWEISNPNTPKVEPVPQLMKHDRGAELTGTTYKIKPPSIGCAMYITINNKVMGDGTLRPLEVFINSKNSTHHQWVMALTRMTSAVFRKPGPIEFAIEELEEVFDPQGGYWDKGEYIPSVVAHVGRVLRTHCVSIGAIEGHSLTVEQETLIATKLEQNAKVGGEMLLCVVCNNKSVVMLDGCLTCTNCGDSKCG